ncbi:DUF960 family protein [Lentilactobacillus kribbianus]|uniref:DUF960 family protein n=1 Tax=Lentilactobacillus kribbianus TaxID=2729622 RepID=UPI001557E352|nr:DUF960 family protein [Lentilactobacillus kribbianus]
MFNKNDARFASYGIVNTLPDDAIDFIWHIIDNDLQGIFPLSNLVKLDLVNFQNKLSYDYIDGDNLVATFDSPYPFSNDYPQSIVVYDNGNQQIIALPNELNL